MEESTNLELFMLQINKKINLDKYIGIVLMNQNIISGIGNYLRADTPQEYLSKINPFRKVKNLNNNEIKTIFNNSKILLWSHYDIKEGMRLKIIKKPIISLSYKSFLIYNQDEDIYGNKVIKQEI